MEKNVQEHGVHIIAFISYFGHGLEEIDIVLMDIEGLKRKTETFRGGSWLNLQARLRENILELP